MMFLLPFPRCSVGISSSAILRKKVASCTTHHQHHRIRQMPCIRRRFSVLQQQGYLIPLSSSSSPFISASSINIRRSSSSSYAPFSSSSPSSWESNMSDSTKVLADSILQKSTSSHKKNHPPSDHDPRPLINRRVAISRAITLLESKNQSKKQQGDMLLSYLMASQTNNNNNQQQHQLQQTAGSSALRVGFAGPPGAGKSSLLESFGMYLLNENKVDDLAVVCIDPSSGISGGSILGDKTRMNELSCHEHAYVRPSSNSGILGGLAAYTDDVVSLLSVAGYPLIFVETVGLGQAEIEITESVDVLVLLLPPGGGDELQGVKKGIVEMAHILAVTKADGNLLPAAKSTAADYRGALRVIQQIATTHCSSDDNSIVWQPPVLLTSSVAKDGLDMLWESIQSYHEFLIRTGELELKRKKQAKYWMWKQFTRMIQTKMKDDPQLSLRATRLEKKLLNGSITPRVAAQELLDTVF